MKNTFCFILLFVCVSASAQNMMSSFKRAANAAEEVQNLANLITIATDIVETSSYTLEQLEQCEKNINQLDNVLESSYAQSSMSMNGRKAWMRKTRWMAGNVKMYTQVLTIMRKIIVDLKEQLAKQQSSDGEIGAAVKEIISNVMKGVKKIPVYGQLVDGAASLFGAGSADAAFIPITNAVKGLDSEDKKATAEEQLMAFLIKINQFNSNISQLYRDTEVAKSSIGNIIGYHIMVSMPNQTVKEYAFRERLIIK